MVVEGSIFNGDFVTDLRLSLLVKIFSNVGHRLSKLLATVWWHIFRPTLCPLSRFLSYPLHKPSLENWSTAV